MSDYHLSVVSIGTIAHGTHLEDAPRDTCEEVADKDHLDVDRKEEDKDAGCHGDLTDHVDRPVSESRLRPTIDEKTEDLSTRSSVIHACLPVGRDGHRTVGLTHPKPVLECTLTEEVVDL